MTSPAHNDPNLTQIARRIRELREILEISPQDAAAAAGVTPAEYERLEAGETDFSFTLLYRLAELFRVDLVELLTGENPRLSGYSVTRAGQGLPIQRREGFEYLHLAARFKNKQAEPFLVTAPWSAEAENAEIPLSSHAGQELDYVLEGSLKVVIEGHTEILNPGDSVYYDSGKGHGMVAVGGKACRFLAIVLKPAQ